MRKLSNRVIALFMSVLMLLSCSVSAFAAAECTADAVYGDTLADVTLPKGYSWNVKTPENVSVGEVGVKTFSATDAKGNSVDVKVTVEPAFIKDISISADSSLYYTGQPVTPTVIAVFGGKTLKENKDYTVAYSDNINVGTATAIVKGIGNFKGETVFYFDILKIDVTGVTVKPAVLETVVGKSSPIIAEVAPSDASFKGITWATSDSSVVEVDENGIATAKALGKAVITVKTNDGSYTAFCEVIVVEHNSESDHKYVMAAESKPTCTSEGSVTYVCGVCDYVKNVTVPAAGHTPQNIRICSDGKCHEYKCSVCESDVKEEHSITDWKSNGDGGYFIIGTESRKCAFCGYSETRTDETTPYLYHMIMSFFETVDNWFVETMTAFAVMLGLSQ